MTEKTEKIEKTITTEPAAPAANAATAARTLEPYVAYRDGDRYRDDVFVAVNGVGYRIKRGSTVMLPRNVSLVLEQSIEQDCAGAAATSSL